MNTDNSLPFTVFNFSPSFRSLNSILPLPHDGLKGQQVPIFFAFKRFVIILPSSFPKARPDGAKSVNGPVPLKTWLSPEAVTPLFKVVRYLSCLTTCVIFDIYFIYVPVE